MRLFAAALVRRDSRSKILLGTPTRLRVDFAQLQQRLQISAILTDLAKVDLGDPISFLGTLARSATRCPAATLIWDVRACEAHGVKGYPFGAKGVLDLHCAGRASAAIEPQIKVTSSVPLTITVRWQGGSKDIVLKGAGT